MDDEQRAAAERPYLCWHSSVHGTRRYGMEWMWGSFVKFAHSRKCYRKTDEYEELSPETK